MDFIQVKVVNKVSKFLEPLQFEAAFNFQESVDAKGIEISIVYLSCLDDRRHDQTLLKEFYGPFPIGKHTITLQCSPVDLSKIQPEEQEGIAFILLSVIKHPETCYQAGYFVNNEYTDGPPRDSGVGLQKTILSDSQMMFSFTRSNGCTITASDVVDFFHPLAL